MSKKPCWHGIMGVVNALINAIAFIAPFIVVALFGLFSYLSLLKQRGFIGLVILLVLGLYTLGVMALGSTTGIPFGEFSYDSALGYQLFGMVPWLIIAVYPALLLAAFWLGSKFTHSPGRVVIAACFVGLIGIILNPILSTLELWRWDLEAWGPYFYGAPLISFAGWLLAGVVGASLLHLLWNKEVSVARGISYSGLTFVLFWTGANIGTRQWIPAAIGGVVSGLILLLAGIERWANTRAEG